MTTKTIPAHSAVLIDLIRRTVGEPCIGCEVGVYRGENAAALLDAFPSLKLYLVDAYNSDVYREKNDGCSRLSNDEQAANFAAAQNAVKDFVDRFYFVISPSIEIAESWYFGDMLFDVLFLDDDHSYPAVSAGLAAWEKKVRPGGLFAGHDYGYHAGVKQAVDEFAERSGRAVHVEAEYIWWLE